MFEAESATTAAGVSTMIRLTRRDRVGTCKKSGSSVGHNAQEDVEAENEFFLGRGGRRRVRIGEVVGGNAILVGRDREQLSKFSFPRLHN